MCVAVPLDGGDDVADGRAAGRDRRRTRPAPAIDRQTRRRRRRSSGFASSKHTRREVDRESKRRLNILVNRIHLTSRQTAAPAATPRAPAPESASRMALQHRRRRSSRPATLMKVRRRGRPCACFAGRNAGGHARTAAAPASPSSRVKATPAATLCAVRRLMTRSAATTAVTSAQRKRRHRAAAAMDFAAAERRDPRRCTRRAAAATGQAVASIAGSRRRPAAG